MKENDIEPDDCVDEINCNEHTDNYQYDQRRDFLHDPELGQRLEDEHRINEDNR